MTIPRKLTSANLVTVAIIVAGLFLTREILVPIAPRYQVTLVEKVHAVRDRVASAGLLLNASNLLKNLGKELDEPERTGIQPPSSLSSSTSSAKPVPVQIRQPDPGASETLVAVIQPLVTPFTTSGIVLIFVIFFLFQREDLRNRFIRLAGSGDLERTTSALDDAAHRLGRLFVSQLILNAVFGVIIGTGLAIIGVPSAPLWGLLAMILRFVPYIGAVLAAILPLALAAAVGRDWSMVLWTAGLFAIVQPIMGYGLDPLISGRSAGLSPVAIVLAASFWTWLWGPLGLLLSTPLTLCLVVVARHVDRLQFIDIMLGDHPALTPQETAYQRMLAADPLEAIEQARRYVKDGSIERYYDEVLLGALRLAQADAELGRLDDARLENIFQIVNEIVEDLGHVKLQHDAANDEPLRSETANIVRFSSDQIPERVLCLPGLGRLDECAVMVTADLLKRHGVAAHSAAASNVNVSEAVSICICYLEDVTEARIGYASRKIARQAPSAEIVFALLGGDQVSLAEWTETFVIAHSLKDTVEAFTKTTIPSGRTTGGPP